MTKDELLAHAASGGKKAHELGHAHQFTSEEAAQAGSLGGIALSKNKAHMSEIGRKGGLSRAKRHGQKMRKPKGDEK